MIERFAGRFTLLHRLGRGGMGTVFLARDETTGAECALKRLDVSTALQAGDARREFEALTRVRHPAVVAVHEFGFAPEGDAYLVMDYVPGLAADRALPLRDVRALAAFAIQVTEGLEALHAAGVTHGDLKPSNVLVLPGEGATGGVCLVDFGLAAILGRSESGHRGTPGYAAPEVVAGEAPGPAADLYGLGALLYTLVTGQRPYESRELDALLAAQHAGPPPIALLEEGGAPGGLIQLILALLAPRPAERPPDARAVRQELERLVPGARRPLAERLRTVRVVGRDRETARIEAWRTSPRRRSSVLWVVGDPGSGRTVLLDQLAVRAALAGHRVIRLAPSALDAPAAVAQALVRRLAAETGARLEPAPADLPTDRSPAEVGAGPRIGPAGMAQAALAAAIDLERAGTPPLVLLDDAPRLDPASAAFFRRLALHPDGFRLPMVWTRALDGTPCELDDALSAAGVAEHIPLTPLDSPALQRLADARLGTPAPTALVEFLTRRSGGSPGLAVAWIDLAARAGAVREDGAGCVADAPALEALEIPADREATMLATLSAWPEQARALLAALAVWGRPATPAELLALAPGAEAGGLETLIATRVAAREPDGTIALRAPRLGATWLASLPELERVTFHRAALAAGPLGPRERFHHLKATGEAAAALAAAREAFTDADDIELADQAATLAEGLDPVVSAQWHERVARAYQTRSRPAASIPPLERALGLVPEGTDAHERAALLSNAYLRAGRLDDLERLVERTLARRPSDGVRARLLNNEAARLADLGDRTGAERVVREALAAAERAEDDEALGGVAMALSGFLLLRGAIDEARVLAVQSEQWSARAGNIRNQARVRGLRASIELEAKRPDEAERLYRSALELARVHGARQAEIEVIQNFGWLLVLLGRWTESDELFATGVRVALEDGQMTLGASLLISSSIGLGLTGRSRIALRTARRGRVFARRYVPGLEGAAMRAIAMALRVAGRLHEAERAARSALAHDERHSPYLDAGWARIELAQALARQGRWETCRAVCDAPPSPTRPSESRAGAILAVLSGRAAVRGASHDAARARLVEAEGLLAGLVAPYADAHVEQLRAELALASGARAEGLAAAQRCLSAYGSLPAPADRAAAALGFAHLALAVDEALEPSIARWLEEAIGLFRRLGDLRARTRALELLLECRKRSAPSAPAAPRERDLIEAVNGLLGSLSDPREVARRALVMAVEQLGAERGVLLFAPSPGGPLVPIAEHGAVDAGTRQEAVTYSRRIVEQVAESGGSLVIGDAPSDPRAFSESVRGLRLRSIVCVPMYLGGRVVGAVYLDHSRRSEVFDDAHRGLLEGVAQLMAVALEKSRGHDEVQRANERLVGENVALRQVVADRFQPDAVIGNSTPMQRVLATVERAAATSATVLITGENGTGKELVARVLHASGKRRHGPFVSVSCAAIPESLLESELFGILANVATGVRAREGRFVQADGGTLFLDELGDMPPSQQVALLSVLASRVVTPVGGGRPIPVDVRIVAATNRDLRRMVDDGSFREDLYYRLNVIPVEVPPLREHKADIPALAQHFAERFARQNEREVPTLSPGFMAAVMQSDWPGNVRELQNYVERVLAMTPGSILHPRPLPRDLEGRATAARPTRLRRLADQVAALERQAIAEALDRARGNVSRAARALGLSDTGIRSRMKKHGLDHPDRVRRPRTPRR